MADLNVQPKRSRALPILVGILLAALVAWLLWQAFGRDEDRTETAGAAATLPAATADAPAGPLDGDPGAA